MKKLDFNTPCQVRDIIDRSERELKSGIKRIAREIYDSNAKIIPLSGPTCSGKTTASGILCDELREMGKKAVVLSIDDFYKENPVFSEDGTPDFETVNSIDTKCMSECVKKLLSGESAMIPQFDFAKRSRSAYKELVPEEGTVYIFEGIQALYPEVRSLFGKESTKSVFICIFEDVEFPSVTFTSDELRLVRRILRDSLFRSSSADKTLGMWKSVRENEERNIFPYADGCDCRIDSYLDYETPFMASSVIAELEKVPEESENHTYALYLSEKLKKISHLSVDREDIPRDSLIREFIG